MKGQHGRVCSWAGHAYLSSRFLASSSGASHPKSIAMIVRQSMTTEVGDGGCLDRE